MRILIYSANFAPEPTGIGKYSGEMAAWLAGHGHELRGVAAPPYYPEGRAARRGCVWPLPSGGGGRTALRYFCPPFRREQWGGVDVWRAPLWVPKSPNGFTRIVHLLSFAITSFPVMM